MSLALHTRPAQATPPSNTVGFDEPAGRSIDVGGIIGRRWRGMLVVALALPILAVALAAAVPQYDHVTARVLYNTTPAEEAIETRAISSGMLDRSIENAIEVSGGDAVRSNVAATLDIEIDDLPDLTVSTEPGTDVVIFTLAGTGDGLDALIVNTWAAAFLDVSRAESLTQIDLAVAGLEERRTEADADQRETRSAALEAMIVELETERELIASGSDRIVTLAESSSPSRMPFSRNLVFSLAAGLFLAAATGIALDARDRTIYSPSDVVDLGIPVLGSIGHVDHLTPAQAATATINAPGSVLSDDAHRLRSAFNSIESAQLIAMVSHAGGDGRSTVVTNLAAAFASAGERTVIVDADLRSPGLGQLLELGTHPGLVEWIKGQASSTSVARRFDRRDIDLVLVPTSHAAANGSALIGSKGFAKVVSQLRTEADRVIFDTSALSTAADATALCAQVDAVVLVARAGVTTSDEILADLDNIERAGGHVVGLALVGTAAPAATR